MFFKTHNIRELQYVYVSNSKYSELKKNKRT